MQYALIQDNTVAQFPYSETQFRRDNPNTSFPKPIKTPTEAQNGTLVAVTEAGRPTVTDTQVAVPDATPTLVDGKWVRGWTVRDKTAEELAEDLDRKKATIKARRDKAMEAGTTINGVSIATDDLSQQRITGAALAANIDNTITVKWKLPDDTFVTLDATQIIGIAQGVREHVQACFDREAELLAALEAGQSYDIDAGWPA